ncbi:L,D-transpeptidase family protein [Conexibacter sp. W3-3-2]|uniref:L,D-transpeptidase family protein n=1 Tax=Conexibacter sp. W3-3-2 TaxID=2675227 RepID=UPI0018AB8023|nr:L,D-transpeptidase family protein [Conexibacter sp. W3-3-2]
MNRGPRTVATALVALATLGALPAGAGASERARLYFTTGEQFRTVTRTLPAGGSTVLPTLRALLRGPTAAERARGIDTQLPKGLRVSSLTITGSGRVRLSMSRELLQGVPVAAAERTPDQTSLLRARLGQLLYTVTQFGDVTGARVLVGDTVVEDDLDRQDYQPPRPTFGTTPGPTTAPAPAAGPVVPGVREIQQRLAELRFLPADAVDGIDGYRTRQAVTAFQAWHGLQRDGVVGPMTQAKLAQAGVPRPRLGGPARRIEVFRDRGVILLIEGGRTVRAIHVSTGAGANATPTGRYTVTRKELRSWSVPYRVYLPYASYFNQGIAFHEWSDVPAFPASHGCVRVPAPEAPVVYAFARTGTAVVVA